MCEIHGWKELAIYFCLFSCGVVLLVQAALLIYEAIDSKRWLG